MAPNETDTTRDRLVGNVGEAVGRAQEARGFATSKGEPDAKRAVAEAMDSVRKIAHADDDIESIVERVQAVIGNYSGLGAARLADPVDDAAKALLDDTDAILARLEIGIARESKSMDALLVRLRNPAT